MEFNGTFYVVIVSFVVFVYLMNTILYKPMLSIIEKRKAYIDANINTANDNNTKADGLAKECRDKLLSAKEESREKYNEVLDSFKKEKAEIIQNAQSVNHNELESAYNELASISNETKEGLKSKVSDLANDIVEKILGYRANIQGFDDNKVNEILYRR